MVVGLVSILAVHAFSGLLFSALEADVERFLSTLVGLSSHGGLIHEELLALNKETVDGDNITVLEMDDVTNVQMVEVKLGFGGFFTIVASDENKFVVLVILGALDKLFFLAPIDEG